MFLPCIGFVLCRWRSWVSSVGLLAVGLVAYDGVVFPPP